MVVCTAGVFPLLPSLARRADGDCLRAAVLRGAAGRSIGAPSAASMAGGSAGAVRRAGGRRTALRAGVGAVAGGTMLDGGITARLLAATARAGADGLSGGLATLVLAPVMEPSFFNAQRAAARAARPTRALSGRKRAIMDFLAQICKCCAVATGVPRRKRRAPHAESAARPSPARGAGAASQSRCPGHVCARGRCVRARQCPRWGSGAQC